MHDLTIDIPVENVKLKITLQLDICVGIGLAKIKKKTLFKNWKFKGCLVLGEELKWAGN